MLSEVVEVPDEPTPSIQPAASPPRDEFFPSSQPAATLPNDDSELFEILNKEHREDMPNYPPLPPAESRELEQRAGSGGHTSSGQEGAEQGQQEGLTYTTNSGEVPIMVDSLADSSKFLSDAPSACAAGCSKHGTCNEELGRCDCPLGYAGDDCSEVRASLLHDPLPIIYIHLVCTTHLFMPGVRARWMSPICTVLKSLPEDSRKPSEAQPSSVHTAI
eukprot:6006856-Pyramimonas_sp.AAC.1